MARDQFLQALDHAAPAHFGGAAVDDHRQRIDGFLVDEDAHLDEVALALADLGVVEAGIALGERLQAIVEIEHDFVERQLIGRLGAAADISEVLLDAATVLAELQHAAEIFVGDIDHRLNPRLGNALDLVGIGHVGGVVQFDRAAAMRQLEFVHHRRCGGDEVEVVLARQALLDDFEVEQPEEAAAEAETERGAGFHLEGEACVVEAQLADAFAQLLEIIGVDREQAAEHHRLDFLEARQRLGGGALGVGDGVADAGLRDFLDLRRNEADFAGAEIGQLLDLGAETADAVDQMQRAGLHELDLLALLQHARHDAHQDDDAEIGVVPAVDQHRLQGRVGIALGWRDAGDDRFEHFGDADAGLGAGQHGVGGVEADHFLDLGLDLVGVGGGEIDLVDDGHDLMIMLDRLIDVGERLRLDALRGIDHQQRAFARGEAAADFIGEVDMTRRVHQIEDIFDAVLGDVAQAHGLRLDGDPAFLLNVHIIKDLFGHFAVAEAAGRLNQAIGKRRLAMIDMGDDAEIADVLKRGHEFARLCAGNRRGGHSIACTPAQSPSSSRSSLCRLTQIGYRASVTTLSGGRVCRKS
ncbi:hypothetical protein D9M73_112970 [compost metagenome]